MGTSRRCVFIRLKHRARDQHEACAQRKRSPQHFNITALGGVTGLWENRQYTTGVMRDGWFADGFLFLSFLSSATGYTFTQIDHDAVS